MKKVLCAILAVLICIGILTICAKAALSGDYGYEIVVGGVGIVEY